MSYTLTAIHQRLRGIDDVANIERGLIAFFGPLPGPAPLALLPPPPLVPAGGDGMQLDQCTSGACGGSDPARGDRGSRFTEHTPLRRVAADDMPRAHVRGSKLTEGECVRSTRRTGGCGCVCARACHAGHQQQLLTTRTGC